MLLSRSLYKLEETIVNGNPCLCSVSFKNAFDMESLQFETFLYLYQSRFPLIQMRALDKEIVNLETLLTRKHNY